MVTIKVRKPGKWFWRKHKVRAYQIINMHRGANGMLYEIKPCLEMIMPSGSLRRIPNIYDMWEFEVENGNLTQEKLPQPQPQMQTPQPVAVQG